MKKQRRIVNVLVLVMILIMGYVTFFPGREAISEEIKNKHFPNVSINKLYKIKNANEKKYFVIENNKTIKVFELNDNTSEIQKKVILPFDEYWFTEKNQGIDTYLVLFKNSTKTEILLFDNDIRPLSSQLTF